MRGEQLYLPFPDPDPSPSARRVPKTSRVFVNRNLRLAGVDFIGFDMDYTLAIYRQEQMDSLSIAATVAKLVAKGYPAYLADVAIDPAFSIRGLLIDKTLGHVLKMDRYKVVQRGYHGMKPLERDAIRAEYQQKKVRPTTPRFHWIDTLYALSEASLYAGIVEALEARGEVPEYAQLFTDIRTSIDEAHRDGTILDAVLADLPRYVDRDDELATTLHKFRSAGKKLFLLTNSRWPYTDRMMTYLLGGAMAEYPSWRHFFDVVVCAAQKPEFFQGSHPLLERDDAELRPVSGPLQRGRVYEGGNLRDFERRLGVTGDRVLYVGDHIYGDILRSKKESAWRTAMIIQEMHAEVAAHDGCEDDLRRLDALADARGRLEEELREWQAVLKDAQRGQTNGRGDEGGEPRQTPSDGERLRAKRAVDRVRAELRRVERESTALEAAVDVRFHRYWGSLLKEGAETSSFGDQVEEYACLYTSRVSNFSMYSPAQYFRSPRDLMPHEL